MAITRGSRNLDSPRKNFVLTPDWGVAIAADLDAYLTSLGSAFPHLRYGSYTGNGEASTVSFPAGVGEPLSVFIVRVSTARVTTVMVPFPGAGLTAWGKSFFTVGSDVNLNAVNEEFRYIVLLNPTG